MVHVSQRRYTHGRQACVNMLSHSVTHFRPIASPACAHTCPHMHTHNNKLKYAEKLESSCIAGGSDSDAATVEIALAVPQEVKQRITV